MCCKCVAAMILGLVFFPACSEEGAKLYIRPWQGAPSRVIVGTKYTISVILSQTVTEKTFVDITNQTPTFASIETDSGDPGTMALKDTNTKSVNITGLSPSGKIKAKFTFTIRDVGSSLDLEFPVEAVIYPDGGTPDKGKVSDKGKAPDQGKIDTAALSDKAKAQ